ncbi:hypothetical protein GC207_03390 [bacterium]|nr:hypothetical protein [bacterium]
MRKQAKLNRLHQTVCLALVLATAGGCASTDDWSFTSRLWTGPAFTKRNAPALLPHLELFADEAHSDVLVVYDEAIDGGSRIRRRAFFVNQNLDRMAEKKKPDFVNPDISRDLKPIPILAAGSEKNLPAHGLAVIENNVDKQLTLYSEGGKLVTVTLPAYFSGGKFGKAMLTPLAVTGDALMIATVVGVIVAIAYAKGHSSGE